MNADTLSADHLREIYRETVSEIYGYVSRRSGGDRELSEDVVQETYLRALGAWCDSGVAAEPVAWLKTTARNLLVSHYRKRRPAGTADIEALARDEPLSSPEDAAWVHWALGQLKREQARLIEAFHLEGKRVREIALELGVSERAIEGRLRRARLALEDQLRSAYPKQDYSS